jgi:hypothetical protein
MRVRRQDATCCSHKAFGTSALCITPSAVIEDHEMVVVLEINEWAFSEFFFCFPHVFYTDVQ